MQIVSQIQNTASRVLNYKWVRNSRQSKRFIMMKGETWSPKNRVSQECILFYFLHSCQPSADERVKMTDFENIRERIRATHREREEETYMIQCGTIGFARLLWLRRRQRGMLREPGERRGSEARVESSTRKADERVTIRGSYQRLFCGFDPHWLATDGYFPLVPLRFGG